MNTTRTSFAALLVTNLATALALAQTPLDKAVMKDRGEPKIKPGDTVVVAQARAKLMLGNRVVAELPKGTTFKVAQVKGKWMGGSVELNGTWKKGGGWRRLVSSGPALAPAVSPTAERQTTFALEAIRAD